MVSITRTTSCFRKYALWKISWYLGNWMHYGRINGWLTPFSRWFWSRLTICNIKSSWCPSRLFTRRIQLEWKILRIEISRYFESWNFRSSLCSCNEWCRNWFDEKNVRYESLLKNNSSLSYWTWLVWWS